MPSKVQSLGKKKICLFDVTLHVMSLQDQGSLGCCLTTGYNLNIKWNRIVLLGAVAQWAGVSCCESLICGTFPIPNSLPLVSCQRTIVFILHTLKDCVLRTFLSVRPMDAIQDIFQCGCTFDLTCMPSDRWTRRERTIERAKSPKTSDLSITEMI